MMEKYTNVPTLLADMLYPDRTKMDVKGSAIEGGRNTAGQSQSIELSGGGILSSSWEDCKITVPIQYEYINWLGALLNGSFRFINVPIITDYYGPFPTLDGRPSLTINRLPHSDETFFVDDTGYSQSTVSGAVRIAAPLNAGKLYLTMTGMARGLRWSDWFSILHPNKGWRAYRYWKVLAAGVEGNAYAYQLAISPPLREAVTAGTRIEFVRPRFVAKFPSDFTLPSISESFYSIQQSIQFEEAF